MTGRRLSREELVEITGKLMTGNVSSDDETSRLVQLFNDNVAHPDGSDLIFFPKVDFQTPQELVDYALSYRPSIGS